MSPDRSADAVVIGAGHNALVAATYLARAGMRVVVCERRDVVGGATVTEEFHPGYRASTASYALSLLRPDVIADLELARHGLVAVAKDPQMFVPLPDGRHFFIWQDRGRTETELEQISPADAEAYSRWCAFWADATKLLRPLLDDPNPPHPQDVCDRAGRPDIYELAVAGSAADTVQAFFSDPGIQGAFVTQGVIGTWASVRDPGTAWVMAYHAMGGELFGSDGTWGYVRGGMGGVSGALAAAASEAGVSVLRESPVTQLLTEGGRVTGVRLASGMVVLAQVVLSGADPKTTFGLVDEDDLDPVFAARVDAWRSPGCVLKVNLALSELPDFTAAPGLGPQHRGTIELAPTIEMMHEAYTDAQTVGHSSRPFIEGFVASAVDPSLVDGEGHVVSLFTQYVAPKTFNWETTKEHATQAVLRTLASYAPNVATSVVAIEALGPPDLEERFGLWGGNIFHGEITPDQCFGARFDYRTPVPGLYLCGSGARPGGCVMGAAGRNAARVVLADMKGE